MHYGLVFGGLLLVFFPPLRKLIGRYVRQPGEGATREEQAQEYIQFQGVATPDTQPKTGKQVWCKADFSGGLYYFTAVLVSQAACSVLQDDIKLPGGVYTTACLGQKYIDRLNDAGFKIETKVIDA